MGLKSENDVHFSISSLVNLLVLIRIVDLCRKRKKSAFIGKSGEMKKSKGKEKSYKLSQMEQGMSIMFSGRFGWLARMD